MPVFEGRKDSRVAIILNKETTTFSLQDMFRDYKRLRYKLRHIVYATI